jgi:outer membrane protein OmpA-like peptidoglycan-associated protein
LNAAANTLNQNPKLNIEIAGYTDNLGIAEINKNLSKRRANTVMIHLIKKGVKAGRLTTKGYGEKDPIAANDTADGRATNRRVELKIN